MQTRKIRGAVMIPICLLATMENKENTFKKQKQIWKSEVLPLWETQQKKWFVNALQNLVCHHEDTFLDG